MPDFHRFSYNPPLCTAQFFCPNLSFLHQSEIFSLSEISPATLNYLFPSLNLSDAKS